MSLFYILWLKLKKAQLQNYKNYTVHPETLGRGINCPRYFWKNGLAQVIYRPCAKYSLKGLKPWKKFAVHLQLIIYTTKYFQAGPWNEKYFSLKHLIIAVTTICMDCCQQSVHKTILVQLVGYWNKKNFYFQNKSQL